MVKGWVISSPRMIWRITQDEYDKKVYQLKQRQYELNERQKQHIEADEKFSFTLVNLMELASRAYELFEFSKVEQKRQLINFVLLNLKLKSKTLEFELRKPFDVFINLKNAKNRSVWLGIVNTLRTIYFKDIISHTPEIKTIKEQYSF